MGHKNHLRSRGNDTCWKIARELPGNTRRDKLASLRGRGNNTVGILQEACHAGLQCPENASPSSPDALGFLHTSLLRPGAGKM